MSYPYSAVVRPQYLTSARTIELLMLFLASAALRPDPVPDPHFPEIKQQPVNALSPCRSNLCRLRSSEAGSNHA